MDCPDAFYLDGCGWGSAYHIGMYRALCDRFGRETVDAKIFGGSSAGALMAVGIVLGISVEDMEKMYERLSEQGRRYGVFGKMSIFQDTVLRTWVAQFEERQRRAAYNNNTRARHIKNGEELLDAAGEPVLEDNIKEMQAYEHCNDRLFIGLTQFPCKFVLKSTFVSNDDLVDTVHASMHIPFYATHIEGVPVRDAKTGTLKKRWFVDGGISKNTDIMLVPDGVTLNISPILSLRLSLVDCVFSVDKARKCELMATARQDIVEFLDAGPPLDEQHCGDEQEVMSDAASNKFCLHRRVDLDAPVGDLRGQFLNQQILIIPEPPPQRPPSTPRRHGTLTACTPRGSFSNIHEAAQVCMPPSGTSTSSGHQFRRQVSKTPFLTPSRNLNRWKAYKPSRSASAKIINGGEIRSDTGSTENMVEILGLHREHDETLDKNPKRRFSSALQEFLTQRVQLHRLLQTRPSEVGRFALAMVFWSGRVGEWALLKNGWQMNALRLAFLLLYAWRRVRLGMRTRKSG